MSSIKYTDKAKELEFWKKTTRHNLCEIIKLTKQGHLTASDLKVLIQQQKSTNSALYKLLKKLDANYETI